MRTGCLHLPLFPNNCLSASSLLRVMPPQPNKRNGGCKHGKRECDPWNDCHNAQIRHGPVRSAPTRRLLNSFYNDIRYLHKPHECRDFRASACEVKRVGDKCAKEAKAEGEERKRLEKKRACGQVDALGCGQKNKQEEDQGVDADKEGENRDYRPSRQKICERGLAAE